MKKIYKNMNNYKRHQNKVRTNRTKTIYSIQQNSIRIILFVIRTNHQIMNLKYLILMMIHNYLANLPNNKLRNNKHKNNKKVPIKKEIIEEERKIKIFSINKIKIIQKFNLKLSPKLPIVNFLIAINKNHLKTTTDNNKLNSKNHILKYKAGNYNSHLKSQTSKNNSHRWGINNNKYSLKIKTLFQAPNNKITKMISIMSLNKKKNNLMINKKYLFFIRKSKKYPNKTEKNSIIEHSLQNMQLMDILKDSQVDCPKFISYVDKIIGLYYFVKIKEAVLEPITTFR